MNTADEKELKYKIKISSVEICWTNLNIYDNFILKVKLIESQTYSQKHQDVNFTVSSVCKVSHVYSQGASVFSNGDGEFCLYLTIWAQVKFVGNFYEGMVSTIILRQTFLVLVRII